MSRPSPNLDDIRFRYQLLGYEMDHLTDTEFRAVTRMVAASAAFQVWTYNPPSDGGLDVESPGFLLLVRMTANKWAKIKERVMDYFDIRDGKAYPKRNWIDLKTGDGRPPIPAAIRSSIMRRDNWTCVYCGTKDGPFDLDHIVPFSRGGSHTSEDNLLCACARCNRSKSDMTPEEWMSGEKPF